LVFLWSSAAGFPPLAGTIVVALPAANKSIGVLPGAQGQGPRSPSPGRRLAPGGFRAVAPVWTAC